MQSKELQEWPHREHQLTAEFRARVAEFVAELDGRGRGQDLDRVVAYTRVPHGGVSRLTAVFWVLDEDYHKPVRDLVDLFREQMRDAVGEEPDDGIVYALMYGVYLELRGADE